MCVPLRNNQRSRGIVFCLQTAFSYRLEFSVHTHFMEHKSCLGKMS